MLFRSESYMNKNQILETIKMLEEEKLDVRTVTMGISLLDCISDNPKTVAKKVYDKICKKAENLVKVSDEVGSKYAIPIVNKRVAVTPISLIGGKATVKEYIEIAKALDKSAKEVGIDFIGGYSALVHKGMTESEKRLLESIPEALSETGIVCSSVNIGSTRCGINMDAVKKLGEIIKKSAYLSRDNGSISCAKLVVFANAVEDNPFMAGAFHGIGERDCSISVGVSGPGTVKAALEKITH